MKPRKAWIVQWAWAGDHAKVEPNIFHVLDSRRSIKYVESYLKDLYLNSCWFTIEERVGIVGTPDPSVIVFTAHGCRASIGTNPHLEAMRVENLTAKFDALTGMDTVEYELPALLRCNNETGKIEEETSRSKWKAEVRH